MRHNSLLHQAQAASGGDTFETPAVSLKAETLARVQRRLPQDLFGEPQETRGATPIEIKQRADRIKEFERTNILARASRADELIRMGVSAQDIPDTELGPWVLLNATGLGGSGFTSATQRGGSSLGVFGGKLPNAFHATGKTFSRPSKKFAGTGMNFGQKGEKAVFFSSDPEVSETFLSGAFVNRLTAPKSSSADIGENVGRHFSDGSRILPANIDTSNFDVWDMFGASYDQKFVRSALKEAKENGASGVLFKDMRDPGLMSTGKGKVSDIFAVIDDKTIKLLDE